MSKLERLTFIDRRVREKGGVRLRDITERFEISERQAKRDIEYLRDRLGAPLGWDASARLYRYGQPWNELAFADERALLFFVLTRAAATNLAIVPLADPSALERLRSMVPKSLLGLEGAIRYELPDFEPANQELLALILAAIKDGQGLDALYRDLEGRESRRFLQPLRIVNYAGTWYCIAFDPEAGGLRTFRLSRFVKASLSQRMPGAQPAPAEVDAFLDASYGMFKGGEGKRACLRFFGRAREIVRLELWHPDQSTAEGTDPVRGDWFELDLPVSHWDEVLGRLLRFGADAEAVSPPEFRQRWKWQVVFPTIRQIRIPTQRRFIPPSLT